MELVQIYLRGKVVGREPVARMPIVVADVIAVLEQEENRIDNAIHQTEMEERRRDH